MQKLIVLFFLPFGIWAQDTATNLFLNTQEYNDIKLLSLEDNTFDILTKGKDPYIFTLPFASNLTKSNSVQQE